MSGNLLFAGGGWRVREMHEADVPRLQRFFEANPEYFVNVGGAPPTATAAQEEFDERTPPPQFPFRAAWVMEWMAADNAMHGMAGVVADIFVPSVWNTGLFIVATHLHGRGTAALMYRQLEAWMQAGGAQWLRLGVVVGNARAERFWERQGYSEVRRRDGIKMGVRSNTVRVMVKPVGAGSIEDYLTLVPRDRPGAP